MQRLKMVSNISKINDFIHDCYFELEDIHFDQHRNSLRIDFRKLAEDKRRFISKKIFLKRYKIPECAYALQIDNVKDWKIVNKEKAEEWDYFNVMKFHADENRIHLLCVLAIELNIEVTGFQVSIYEADGIIQEKIKYSLF